jgi:hypothetical protein
MRAAEFFDRVTTGGGGTLNELLTLLNAAGIRFCVIGGQAVNNYAEPLVSLDLVIALDRHTEVESLLQERFEVRRLPRSLNATPATPTYGYRSKRTLAMRAL